ncbi:hypothetical protein CALVIDRAFT_17419 [Calocera viscosa TUFC12733]|uniref:BTB domain-containing protein n=1 Tax=Calocera viscosa (strain TUFC12733) TaxID=1330018 RepID=A0A167SBP6_CALVF|nr:hypothetical protein CALVIDRAFT_17419 [Calocera viscosa TUFC12733]
MFLCSRMNIMAHISCTDCLLPTDNLTPERLRHTLLMMAHSSQGSSASSLPSWLFNLPPALKASVDLIIKSSNGVEFHVHSDRMSAASRILSDMFAVSPSTSKANINHNPPTVVLSESTEVLDVLLCSIYSLPTHFGPHDLPMLIASLKATEKYEMNFVKSFLYLHLCTPPFLELDPVAILSIARAQGMNAEALRAFAATYERTEDELLCNQDDKDGLHAKNLVLILSLRHHRAEAMLASIDELVAKRSHAVPRCQACQKVHPWVHWWLKDVAQELKQRPVTDNIFSVKFLKRARACYASLCGCPMPKDHSTLDLIALKPRIDVEFPLPESWESPIM